MADALVPDPKLLDEKKKRAMELNPGSKPESFEMFSDRQLDEIIRAGEARAAAAAKPLVAPAAVQPAPKTFREVLKERLEPVVEGFLPEANKFDVKEKKKSEEIVKRLRIRQSD